MIIIIPPAVSCVFVIIDSSSFAVETHHRPVGQRPSDPHCFQANNNANSHTRFPRQLTLASVSISPLSTHGQETNERTQSDGAFQFRCADMFRVQLTCVCVCLCMEKPLGVAL